MAGSDAQLSSSGEGRHLLLFDGVCGLCSRMVRFILACDRHQVFHFASLQSEMGRALVTRMGGNPDTLTSLYVIADYRTPQAKGLIKGRAQLFIVRALGWPWKVAAALSVLPVGWLDRLYDVVARYRYGVFGRYDECPLPRPEHRHRFLDS
jgi:predicted DCC family thiol-disulfide oxidoreductase YuxK